MKSEELQAITDSINAKVGDELASIIADDLGTLLTKNTQTLNELDSKNKEISRLKDNNEKLVIANGNLLKQIPASSEYEKHQKVSEEPREEKKSFNFMNAFDEKGHFKRQF